MNYIILNMRSLDKYIILVIFNALVLNKVTKGDRTNGSWSRFIKTATERYISNMAKIESTLFATLINNTLGQDQIPRILTVGETKCY